jgi:hypothetical protein
MDNLDITKEAIIKLTPSGALVFLLGVMILLIVYRLIKYKETRDKKKDSDTLTKSIIDLGESMINITLMIQRSVIQTEVLISGNANYLTEDLILNIAERIFQLSRFKITRMYADYQKDSSMQLDDKIIVSKTRIRNLYNSDLDLMNKIKYDKLNSLTHSVGNCMNKEWSNKIQELIVIAFTNNMSYTVFNTKISTLFEEFTSEFNSNISKNLKYE